MSSAIEIQVKTKIINQQKILMRNCNTTENKNEHSFANPTKTCFQRAQLSFQQNRVSQKENFSKSQSQNIEVLESQNIGQDLSGDQSDTKRVRRQTVSWTTEQDRILFEKFLIHRSKWVEISQYLPNKNDNDVKNRFYCCVKKVQKYINVAQKVKKIKSGKLVSHDSLLTVLEIGKFDYTALDKRFEEIKKNVVSILQARNLIIELAQQTQEEVDHAKVECLTELLVGLKHCLKFINIKRVKKSAQRKVSQVMSARKATASEQVEEQFDGGEETKRLSNEEDTKMLDELLDIENLSEKLLAMQKPSSISLIQSCRDVLCPTILVKEKC